MSVSILRVLVAFVAAMASLIVAAPSFASGTPVAQEAATIGGNGLDLVPAGRGDGLEVVLQGTYDGNVLPVIIRNNAKESMSSLTVVSVARDSDGKMIATGGDQGVRPKVIPAGGVALAYLYFDGVALAGDTQFEFEVDGEAAGNNSSSRGDLVVQEVNLIDDRLVGMFRNTNDYEVTGPIGIYATCLAEDGSLIGMATGYTDKDSAGPGGTVPFQISVRNEFGCPYYLVAASGYDF